MSVTCDVVVVGAGFAGAAAASVAAKRGLGVAILEARDRVGGRAYSRPFAGEVLEFGGGWITPWQKRIRRYAEENGVGLRPRAEVTGRAWHDGSALRADGPCEATERAAYVAAMRRINEDAARYAEGQRTDRNGESIVSLSLNAYLERIAAGPAARSQVFAWWMISGNGDPDVVSAAEFLASCAYGGGSPEGMLEKLRHGLVPGASALVERMIERSGAALRLEWPVAGIRQDGTGVLVESADGRSLKARYGILATPLNTIADMVFEPPLPADKARAAARRHEGATRKMWIRARGPEVGRLATGGGETLPWMFCERASPDGSVLIVGFGLARASLGDEAQVFAALDRLFPGAELLDWGCHDWVGDPYAKGTWVALPADALEIADPALWAAEGRLAFAGSDIAREEPGWFEAAISSGEEAARWVAERIGAEPEQRPVVSIPL